MFLPTPHIQTAMPATLSTKSTKPQVPSLPGYSSFSLELTSGNVEPDPKNKFTSAFNQFVPDTTDPNARLRKPRKPYKKALIPNPRLRHPWEQHLTKFQSTYTSSRSATTAHEMPILALGSPAQVLSQLGQAQVLSWQLSGDDSMDVEMESPNPSSQSSSSGSQSSHGLSKLSSLVPSSSPSFNRTDTPAEHCDYMRASKRSHDQAFPELSSV